LKFIKELVKKINSTKHNYILLDNARIHHYGKIRDFISTLSKIKLIYNIPYTPETNPIERVFNDLKNILRTKKLTNAKLFDDIKESLLEINNKNFEAYYKKSFIDEMNKL
jgi:transposase